MKDTLVKLMKAGI